MCLLQKRHIRILSTSYETKGAAPLNPKDLFKRKQKKDRDDLDDQKKTRDLPPRLNAALSVVLILLGLFHLYVAFFGTRSSIELRAIHWTTLSTVIFFFYPAFKQRKAHLTFMDIIWALGASSSGLYILASWERIAVSGGLVNTVDIVFGCNRPCWWFWRRHGAPSAMFSPCSPVFSYFTVSLDTSYPVCWDTAGIR